MSDEPIAFTPPARRDGAAPLTAGGARIGPSLGDFWAWNSSDLLSNSLRGVFAEFLVGTALGCIADDETRLEWDAQDFVTADGVGVEVKSTAYLQSWGPTTPTSLRFRIGETLGWDARKNTFGTDRRRQAQVYVFCVFTSTDRAAADPLNTDQWEFHVASIELLDSCFPRQKTVSLSVLRGTPGVVECDYSGIRAAVAAGSTHRDDL